MLKFSAHEWFMMARILGVVIDLLSISPEQPLKAQTKEKLLSLMNDLDVTVTTVGLRLSRKHVLATMQAISSDQKAGQLKQLVEELCQRIHDESEDCLFMQIPGGKAEFFNDARTLFGNETLEKFPSAIPEVMEAGKCYAAGRNTACVFHLMRVLEVGLRVVALNLGITMDVNRSWHTNLTKIETAAKALHPNAEWTDFYTNLVARFHAVKDSQRNPTMHVEGTYNEEEAKEIFTLVGSFIRHLSIKLSEVAS